jgi:hypothetical protein
MKGEAVEPAFRVFKGRTDIRPGEWFNVCRVVIIDEAVVNEFAFSVGEEGSRGRVVVD